MIKANVGELKQRLAALADRANGLRGMLIAFEGADTLVGLSVEQADAVLATVAAGAADVQSAFDLAKEAFTASEEL